MLVRLMRDPGTDGAGGRTRTDDLAITSRLRYHLRHAGLVERVYRAEDACRNTNEYINSP